MLLGYHLFIKDINQLRFPCHSHTTFVIPVKAGIQLSLSIFWTPAFAGVTGIGIYSTFGTIPLFHKITNIFND